MEYEHIQRAPSMMTSAAITPYKRNRIHWTKVSLNTFVLLGLKKAKRAVAA